MKIQIKTLFYSFLLASWKHANIYIHAFISHPQQEQKESDYLTNGLLGWSLSNWPLCIHEDDK